MRAAMPAMNPHVGFIIVKWEYGGRCQKNGRKCPCVSNLRDLIITR